ncbi:YceD family protein [Marinimicrobium alkaliphilum]|uniref:YceD family protein n=1 Tax=Marinimicrobium alkaliphilum TaxID=2202654 RepID=UPI000DBA6F0B|nr:YceD family protein [Marinimicrobium alkaliphilum]
MLKTPSDKLLPRQADPRKFAQQGITLTGVIPVEKLPRIADVVDGAQSPVRVTLAFGFSEEGKRVMTSHVAAELNLECQRCLESVTVPIEAETTLAIVWTEEQAKALPKYLEPWQVGEGQTDLYVVVEEELLLAMPVVAYHEEPCIDDALFSSGEPVVEQASEKNPFHILEQLKGSPKS